MAKGRFLRGLLALALAVPGAGTSYAAAQPELPPTRVALALQPFETVTGDPDATALAGVLPTILKLSVQDQRWLRLVESLGRAPKQTGPRAGGAATAASASYLLRGAIVRIGSRIHIDAVVVDLQDETEVLFDSAAFEPGQALPALHELGRRLAEKLAELALEHSGPLSVSLTEVELTGSEAETYGYLGWLLPEFAADGLNTRQARWIQAAVGSPAAEETPDFEVSASGRAEPETISLDVRVRDRSGWTCRFALKGPTDSPFELAERLTRRVAEVIDGRTLADGSLRPDAHLEVGAGTGAEEHLEHARDYRKRGEAAAALLHYRLAAEEGGALESRLGLGRLLLEQERFEEALREFESVLEIGRPPEGILGAAQALMALGRQDEAETLVHEAFAGDELPAALAIEAHEALAEIHAQAGAYGEEAEEYRLILEIDPRHGPGRIGLAQALTYQGLYGEAERVLGEGLALGTGDAELKNALAGVVLARAETEVVTEDELSAIAHDEEIRSPLRARALYQLAAVLNVGQEPQAERYLLEASSLDPENVDILAFLAWLYLDTQRLDQAADFLKRALEIRPDSLLYQELADIHRRQGLAARARQPATPEMQQEARTAFDRALNALRQALALDPFDSWIYRSMAEIHRLKDEPQAGVDILTEALDLFGYEDAGLVGLRGVLYSDMGEFEPAAADLRRAIEIEPSSSAHLELAWAEHLLGEHEQALANVREGLEYGTEEVELLELAEIVSESLGRPLEAIEIFEGLTSSQPRWVEPYLRLADHHEASGDYEMAEGVLREAIENNPHEGEPYLRMGQLLMETGRPGDLERAKRALEEAVEIEPTSAAYRELADNYRRRADGDFDTQLNYLKAAIRLQPDDQQLYNRLQDLSTEVFRYPSYLEFIRDQLADHQDLIWLWNEVGIALLNQNRLDEAIEHFSAAKNQQPDDEWPSRLLAITYHEKGDLERALKFLEEAIAKRETVFSYRVLGEIHAERGDYSKAIEAFENALRVVPGDARSYYELAELHRQLEDLPAAEEVLRSGLEKASRPAGLWAELAINLATQNRGDEALEATATALELGGDEGGVHLGVALVHQRLGNVEAATAAALESLELHPFQGGPFGVIRQVMRESGEPMRAVEIIERYLQDHPENHVALSNLAAAYHEEVLDYERAYAASARAVVLNGDPSYQANHAEACLTSGRTEEALALIRKIRRDQTHSDQTALSLRVFEIAALLILERQGDAFERVRPFLRHYRRAVRKQKDSWLYDGTEAFLRGEPSLMDSQRTLLLDLIGLLKAPEDLAADHLREFESRWASVMESLSLPAETRTSDASIE